MIAKLYNNFASRLGTRLAGMVVIALLPLGLLSFMQTRDALELSNETRLLAAIGETVQAGHSEFRITRSAQNAARLLASTLSDGLENPEDCMAKVRSFAASETSAALVAFVPVSGLATCTSDRITRDFSKTKRFAELIAQPAPAMFSDPEWSDSGAEMLAVSHQVRDAAGQLVGMSLIYVAQSTLANASATLSGAPEPTTAILVGLNRTGDIIYSSIGIPAALEELPTAHGLDRLTKMGVTSFFGKSKNGSDHIFATVPVSDDLFFLGVWPYAPTTGFWLASQPYVLPLLMWLAAAVVAALGAERLVTRHIRKLWTDMDAFAQGARNRGELRLSDPPQEIADLASAYRRMTHTILHDEAQLEYLLRQKEDLLREVHHRTGNSLQLIASFLRMHRRETQDDEIRMILDDLHNRVISLSSVHMGLYRMAGRTEVAVDELMAEVITKVGLVFGRSGRKGRINSELDPVMLTSEQAVPLALLLAEALSAFPVTEVEDMPITIALEALAPNRAQLRIAGNHAARARLTGDRDGAPAIIAARLLRGFASQLGSELQVQDLPDDKVEMSVTFDVRQPQYDATTGTFPEGGDAQRIAN